MAKSRKGARFLGGPASVPVLWRWCPLKQTPEVLLHCTPVCNPVDSLIAPWLSRRPVTGQPAVETPCTGRNRHLASSSSNSEASFPKTAPH